MPEPGPKVWFEGAITDAAAAQLPVFTHSFHYGLGAFEGIRSYRLADGRSAVFRLREHVDRLFETAHLLTLGTILKWTRRDVVQACIDTLRANGLAEGYLRPIVYIGEGLMGLGAMTNPVHMLVVSWQWGPYHGQEGILRGIRTKVSTYRRQGHASVAVRGKITGHYVDAILAKREAILHGYDEALMLDAEGMVTGGTGENLFCVMDGRLVTPPPSATVIAGLTRETVIRLGADFGMPCEQRPLRVVDLLEADEVFVTGTAAEITPVREIDGKPIGRSAFRGGRGPVTSALQERFFRAVRGQCEELTGWLTPYEVVEQ